MAKNSVEAYGAEGKTNLLFFNPENLILVSDPLHALYDSRVHLPVDEAMVLNLMHQGINQPVVVTKDRESGDVLVVAGRQRVKAAIEANKRFEAQGKPDRIKVPAVIKTGEAFALSSVMVSENEIRTPDSPIGRAEKMQKLVERGTTEADLCILFGVGVGTIRASLALLTCAADVRKAVDTGRINVTHAVKLASKTPDEQRAVLDELLAAGEGVTGHAKARAQRAVVEGAKARTKPRAKDVKAKVEDLLATENLDDKQTGYLQALQWVLGSRPDHEATAPVST